MLKVESYEEIYSAIGEASHVAIYLKERADMCSLACASALYTFLLQEHKKASFVVASKELPKAYKTLPWSEKIREVLPLKLDLVLDLEAVFPSSAEGMTLAVEDFLIQTKAKINTKMAHALYCALYVESEAFTHQNLDDKSFECAARLLRAGASVQAIKENLDYSQALSSLRLKSEVLNRFELLNDARYASVSLDQNILDHCGAQVEDIVPSIRALLRLGTVSIAFCIFTKNGERRVIIEEMDTGCLKTLTPVSTDISVDSFKDQIVEYIKGEKS